MGPVCRTVISWMGILANTNWGNTVPFLLQPGPHRAIKVSMPASKPIEFHISAGCEVLAYCDGKSVHIGTKWLYLALMTMWSGRVRAKRIISGFSKLVAHEVLHIAWYGEATTAEGHRMMRKLKFY